MNDVVYFVKESLTNEELRYSLRTLELNFPYRRVWFYGGCPAGLNPDRHVYVDQDQLGNTKWQHTAGMLKMVCSNDEISEDFWLFNDDFFVIRKVPEDMRNVSCGSMYDLITRTEEKHGGSSNYTRLMREAMHALSSEGYPTWNYATHTPMLINRAKCLQTLEKFATHPMFRNLYGNMWKISAEDWRDDCKIQDLDKKPDTFYPYLSTSDRSFSLGAVGKWIRKKYPTPSRFET